MVRRSALVYDLLRIEQPPDGFSKKEILTHISDKYDIAIGKALRRDITVALRRGLDFGILAKKRNKFRFNPDFYQTTNSRHNILSETTRKNTSTKKRKRSSKKKATGRSNVTKGRRQQRRRSSNRESRDRKQSNPRPKLPKSPSWSPKRRLLIEEPIPKVKRF
ncbi:hypothetical protein ALC60_00322 [Trachymyrmex zeteki]|uniref:H15 domain-containing protein n=1 Tax=Mycetomoellerius zeteki TaxID=64791 RepID=A0A151XK33_9HYME|nr:PREDICTED: uncharacterized protein LOC108732108 [Trachymyrmex zeteki]KYQ60697.1 hypothetical protein ALC60_00322 [Trachymyrmex zeteki]